jgi:hypothetical protein
MMDKADVCWCVRHFKNVKIVVESDKHPVHSLISKNDYAVEMHG